jgi:hypothetical protein
VPMIEGLEEREIELDGALVQDFKVSDHFWLSEFRLFWPRQVPLHDRFPVMFPDMRLAGRFARGLELVRAHFGKPVVITDCMRPGWIKRYITGAANNSRHNTINILAGVMAVDFKIPGIPMLEVYKGTEGLMDKPATGMFQGGLGYYYNHVHLDNRRERIRWGSKGKIDPAKPT